MKFLLSYQWLVDVLGKVYGQTLGGGIFLRISQLLAVGRGSGALSPRNVRRTAAPVVDLEELRFFRAKKFRAARVAIPRVKRVAQQVNEKLVAWLYVDMF